MRKRERKKKWKRSRWRRMGRRMMMMKRVNHRCQQEELRRGDSALRYLDGLSVLLEDVDPHHRFVELGIQGLDDFIVEMLLHNVKIKQGIT